MTATSPTAGGDDSQESTEGQHRHQWCRDILKGLDEGASGDPATPISDIDAQPRWATRALLEVLQSVCPALRLMDLVKEPMPAVVGAFLGQDVANKWELTEQLAKLGEMVQSDPSFSAKVGKITDLFESNRANPIVDSAVKAGELLVWTMDDLPAELERTEKRVFEAFRAALDQPVRTDAAEFFRGFAHGLATPGLGEFGLRPERETTTTAIYRTIALHWREIEKLPNLPALEEFLTLRGVKPQLRENRKRLEKLCQRIGLKLGKRGRPKKARKSDAPPS